MNRKEAIAELNRIWHSPYLDLSLKGGLAEAIEALKEDHPWCVECKEYDQEQHCCHRWSSQIRMTIEDWERDNDIVRCKDCKYWQDNQKGHYPNELCPWDKAETPDPDDFCSFGERREDGEA